MSFAGTPALGIEPISQPYLISPDAPATVETALGNIREEPCLESNVKYRLKKGDSVHIEKRQGEWLLVAFQTDKRGWAHESLFDPKLLAANTETSTRPTAQPEKPLPASRPEPQYAIPQIMKWHSDNPDRFTLVAEGTFLYSMSDLEGSDTLDGGDIQGVISPSLKLDDRTRFIFLYSGQWYKRREFYSDDIGPRERSEFQGHTFTPMLRFSFGERERFSITPSLFYTTTLNKDIDSDAWDGGLYNYRDIGGGLDFSAAGLGFAGGQGTFSLGTQYYVRKYPNYVSLLDLATGLGIEEDEKDYHGILVRTGYNWLQQSGLSWAANYSMLYKLLNDKKVVDSNGILSDDTQRDQLHTLDLNFWYLFDLGIKIGFDPTVGYNHSNQNWYDGMGTISLEDDVFIPDYYNYFLYRIRPNISYTFGVFGLFPFTATYAYSFMEMLYTDRKAKRADATYKPDDQTDQQQQHFVELRYEFNRRLSLIAQFQHITNRSNNDDESVYRYNYKVYNYFAGIQLRY